ncbi:MAG TPA: sigma-54-dependent Fis family transcriptional regulator [Chromatiales bacterium]|nr:sigma-54-dependent Fis family transcriptional regulator [Thiotrichales bacterium]HIP67828.1 sigma-54-dependent Fis family transcriptional regulator [Chromatiales bacterium]
MSINNILIIDDEPDIRELLELTLARMGLDATCTADVKTAKTALENKSFDLCLTDMNLSDGTGLEIVEHIQHTQPDLPVAVITAYGSMELAVQSLKAGAFDFVSKPIDLKILRGLIESALKVAKKKSPSSSQELLGSKLLGSSDAMNQLRSTISKLARSQAPVYIHGESGSGKELVAREIHDMGPRADNPFIAVNCGAIPSELMESEFFGHKKGSFTGATTDKEGLFMAAQGGTLLLDEVADLPQAMQVKLLRAIQERAVKPIGEHQEQSVDVRILCATHKNLAEEVQAGRFRQDLYYRLNVIQLDVPPLRERAEDISILADFFLEKIAGQWQNPKLELSEDAQKKLAAYSFPGNVRELENILERSATLCENTTLKADDISLPETATSEKQTANLPPETPDDTGTLKQTLTEQEKTAILEALEATRWNKTAAAKQLGYTLRQLRYRLKKLDLE